MQPHPLKKEKIKVGVILYWGRDLKQFEYTTNLVSIAVGDKDFWEEKWEHTKESFEKSCFKLAPYGGGKRLPSFLLYRILQF